MIDIGSDRISHRFVAATKDHDVSGDAAEHHHADPALHRIPFSRFSIRFREVFLNSPEHAGVSSIIIGGLSNSHEGRSIREKQGRN